MRRNRFKSDHRTDQCYDEKYSPEAYRIFKKENSHQYGSHCTNACPYGVSCSNRESLCRFDQQKHTYRKRDQETSEPKIHGCSACFFYFSQTGSKSNFK